MAYSSSDDSSYYDDDDSSVNSDDFVVCNICNAQVKRRNCQRHLENVHQCPHCKEQMPKKSLAGHIKRKHMIKCKYCPTEEVINQIGQHEATHFVPCKYCGKKIFERDVDKHNLQNHSIESIIGSIQLQKISDARFNQLVAQNRIFAKYGHLFIQPQ